MGFIPDVKRVLALLPKQRQNLLFSATFSAEIKALADRLLNRPQVIEVTPPNSTVDAIAQRVHPVNREEKAKLLAWLVGHHRWRQVLVFTRTKHGADKLVRSLHADGIGAVALHGNKSQNARTRALADFKAGEVEVMVATDIAARGIDIDQLPHVVNYDLPNVPEDYVHRIGRTGRAGNEGEAISLVCVDEHGFLRDIERLIKRTIPQQVMPGFEPDPNAVAQTVFTQRGRGQGQGQRAGAPQGRSGSGRAPQREPQSTPGAPHARRQREQPKGRTPAHGAAKDSAQSPTAGRRHADGPAARGSVPANGSQHPRGAPPAAGHARGRPVTAGNGNTHPRGTPAGSGTPRAAAPGQGSGGRPHGRDPVAIRASATPALFQPRGKTKH
jgi:ATP-dependent RNA helicase RhlE